MRSDAYHDLTRQGTSSPLGATPGPEGTNFSVYSKHATAIELLLFDRVDDARAARALRLEPALNRTYHYWHLFVPGVRAGQIYGYRVEGPWDPANGLRFDPAKVLLDPYGREVAVPEGYDRGAAGGPGDNSATAMKSVVVDPAAYDWEGDAPLRRPKAWRFTLHSSNDCNQVGRPQSVASTSSGTVRPAIVICSGSVGRVELQCGMDLLHREGAPGVIDAKQRGHRHPLPCGNLESLYRDACAGRRGERCVAICFRRLPFTKRTRR